MKEIQNARITKVDLSMADHGCLTLALHVEGKGWGCCIGGYVLGHGYVGAEEFDGSPKGIEEIMRIMDVVGVNRFNEMQNKYIRVETEGWGGSIHKIGNIIEDKWFDYHEFYKKEREDFNK